MFDAIKPLLDSGLINESVGQELNEAWETKLTEAREQVRAELREEFARRYEHDKSVMVEALDRMVQEGLTSEVAAIAAEKQALAEDRVKFQRSMKENAEKFNGFLVSKLAEEITELRKDRKAQTESIDKLESFVVKALAQEIREFAEDKKDMVATKVRLVKEARGKLETLKARFIKESAAKMSKLVSESLQSEMKQLHEDIKVARENNFGRRIFEAFATEFGATHLNENAEMRKLQKALATREKQLAESIKINKKAKTLVESKEKEIRIIKESNVRAQTLDELLGPLNDEKRSVMANLLENVQTSRLKNAFEKYLPAVLAETKSSAPKKVLAESMTAVTGDKSAKVVEAQDTVESNNVIDLKRLAGL